MTYKEAVELARYFAELLGNTTRQLSFAGLALVWVLSRGDVTSLPELLWFPGVFFLSALIADHCHSITGALWGGRIAWQLATNQGQEHNSAGLFRTLYGLFIARCSILLVGYALLLIHLWRVTRASASTLQSSCLLSWVVRTELVENRRNEIGHFISER